RPPTIYHQLPTSMPDILASGIGNGGSAVMCNAPASTVILKVLSWCPFSLLPPATYKASSQLAEAPYPNGTGSLPGWSHAVPLFSEKNTLSVHRFVPPSQGSLPSGKLAPPARMKPP